MKIINNKTDILIGGILGYVASVLFLICFRYFFGGWSSLFDGTIEKHVFDSELFFGYVILSMGVLLYLIFFYIFVFLNKNFFSRSLKIKNAVAISASYILILVLYVDIFADISSTGPERPSNLIDLTIRFTLIVIYPIVMIYLNSTKNRLEN